MRVSNLPPAPSKPGPPTPLCCHMDLIIDRVQRHGTALTVIYFQSEQISTSCKEIKGMKISTQSCGWSEFLALEGAKAALDALSGLERFIQDYERQLPKLVTLEGHAPPRDVIFHLEREVNTAEHGRSKSNRPYPELLMAHRYYHVTEIFRSGRGYHANVVTSYLETITENSAGSSFMQTIQQTKELSLPWSDLITSKPEDRLTFITSKPEDGLTVITPKPKDALTAWVRLMRWLSICFP